MKTKINLHIIENFQCLEPEIGKTLLPFYPEFLETDQRTRFELHLEICEHCQERWKLWQATGFSLRIETLLEWAQALLEERQYEEAITAYNRVIALAPDVIETTAGQKIFRSEAWLTLTAAWNKEQDLLSYLTPNDSPGAYEMAAATSAFSSFPLMVEYDRGRIKGKITAIGRLIFFELLETGKGLESGIRLVGKILQPAVALCIWEISSREKKRLGTIESLFGSTDFPDVIRTLKTFRVFPLSS